MTSSTNLSNISSLRRLLSSVNFYIILLILSRFSLPLFINTVPPMDIQYINLADKIASSSTSITFSVSPFYASIMYVVNIFFGNWKLSSLFLCSVFSIITGMLLYGLTKKMFNNDIAKIVLLLIIFHPNFTIALIGYSHTVIVSSAFLLLYFYYFWDLLTERSTIYTYTICSLAITVAILIRPELILYFLFFTLLHIGVAVFQKAKIDLLIRSRNTVFMVSIAVIVVAVQYTIIARRTNSTFMNFFTDARYSYETYTHTLSLRSVGSIDADLARKLASNAYGNPETFEYSVVQAILINPKESAKNVGYNVRYLLQNAAHPLFMPFFLYFFIGIGIFVTSIHQTWKHYMLLIGILVPCLVSVLVFHVEVRYLNPIAIPCTIWLALGLHHLWVVNKKHVVYSFFCLYIVFFIANIIYYSANPISI